MWLRGCPGDKFLFYLAWCLKHTTITQTKEETWCKHIWIWLSNPWLNTCRHVLTAGSWCAKLSKLHKKWDFWLSSPFHCLTAVISHFLEKTQDQKSLQKADLFRHFSQSQALFLLLFLSASCSGSKDIWLWEEEKQPPQIFVSLSYFISMQTYHHQTISFWK